MYFSIHHYNYSQEVKGKEDTYLVTFGKNQYAANTAHAVHDRDWSCTCPDWKMRRRKQGGYCKHIEAVQENNNRCLWKGEECSLLVSSVFFELMKKILAGDTLTYPLDEDAEVKSIVPPSETGGQIVEAIWVEKGASVETSIDLESDTTEEGDGGVESSPKPITKAKTRRAMPVAPTTSKKETKTNKEESEDDTSSIEQNIVRKGKAKRSMRPPAFKAKPKTSDESSEEESKEVQTTDAPKPKFNMPKPPSRKNKDAAKNSS